MDSPTPEQIKEARENAGLTQTQAAEMVCCGITTWQKWEYGTNKMHPGFWKLFKIEVKNNA